jgi:uncharacterized repeat protein (TIGR03803 family)
MKMTTPILGITMVGVLGLIVTTATVSAQITDLASFNDTDGANPGGSLTLIGSTLYGTTEGGGAYGEGTVFSVPVGGGAPTDLASFDGGDGGSPRGSLTLSSDGSTFYGTTESGGGPHGAVFSVPVGGGALTDLAKFNGANGASPDGSLTLIGSTLYGTTVGGGANSAGTVFSAPVGGGAPTVLASFGFSNGEGPRGSLTLSSDGSTFYGTTESGALFSVPVGGGTPTALAGFNGANGEDPFGSLTLSSDGRTLYGATEAGGANGDGTVFSAPVDGGTPTDLASFNGANGSGPRGSLTLIGSMLYGTTATGGAYGDGTVFSTPVGGGTTTVLASFNGANGASPSGDLTVSSDGSTFYGTTSGGGANGDGTVFSVLISVPEPGSAALLALGAGALLGRRRR